MNKTDNTKQVRHGILLLNCLHLPKPAYTITIKFYIKDINIKTSKQLLYKLCFTVEQPLIHETAGLFPVKIENSRMRITSKTVHDINKMEGNFALHYVFTYSGIISRAELIPSHGASRRRLGERFRSYFINFVWFHFLILVISTTSSRRNSIIQSIPDLQSSQAKTTSKWTIVAQQLKVSKHGVLHEWIGW
jgi:hypothetical protein